MLFYRIDVELSGLPESIDRAKQHEQARHLQVVIEDFFIKADRQYHIAIMNISLLKQKAILCAVTKDNIQITQFIDSFLSSADLTHNGYNIQEITLDSYSNLLRASRRNGYVSDDEEIAERFNIVELYRRFPNPGIRFSETVLNQKYSQKELRVLSANLPCGDNLTSEIDRIYQGTRVKSAYGHPVHYVVQADNPEIREQILTLLLVALHKNGRIKSRRYCEVSYNEDSRLPGGGLKSLYESCFGGTLVISFGESGSDEGEYARVGVDIINMLCSTIRKYKNNVLTIICLKRSCESVKNVFLEHLGATTIVQLGEEAVFGEQAKAYLGSLAKKHGVKADRALYRHITDVEKSFSASELNLAFDEWYDRKLKTHVYAQYADMVSANKQLAKRHPKGSAYSELSGLIGLSEAKKAINQALDLYKAQILFKEKGLAYKRPSMHMAFTGNPGTAKTTAARLFAQIMKDNNLLSVGDLYEVSRADLVGKYVGWTAKLVAQKFRDAKGSVLFIDEAYSLVERDGLYGDEAINTIVQEMENRREDMVVIFAGYTDKMEAFFDKNPGLRSRIAFHVHFNDYDSDELYQIIELLAHKKQYELGDRVKEKLTPIFDSARKSADFGNGRFARNLLEKAMMNQAGRLICKGVEHVTKTETSLLLAEDFEAPAIVQKRRIGF